MAVMEGTVVEWGRAALVALVTALVVAVVAVAVAAVVEKGS